VRRLHRLAPCKVNLLLNVLGRRADGFHELETLIQPVPIHDELEFERGAVSGFQLTCSDPRLPVDARNLVHRAATAFINESGAAEGIHIHLAKRIPMEAGLGGGSGNAAHTLLGLNELFDRPLGLDTLCRLGAALGSDVVCFLDPRPALATGRGESVEWVEPFACLHGCGLVLVHPGFGVSTPWAYQALARYPEAVAGTPGRARQLVECLRQNDSRTAAARFFNALEAPVLSKYPLLACFQEFLLGEGAIQALMSGSGSATFALTTNLEDAERLQERVKSKFGPECWTAAVRL
jgi:4-diphosphocytidyl-2-C-methyl-D-erythritol kinase